MARTSVSSDVYNAIGEPRRRQIFEILCQGEQPVNALVTQIGIDQPAVSKHLKVLREVGLVTVRPCGKQRRYSANPDALRPVHEWIGQFERYWSYQLDAIKTRAEATQRTKPKDR